MDGQMDILIILYLSQPTTRTPYQSECFTLRPRSTTPLEGQRNRVLCTSGSPHRGPTSGAHHLVHSGHRAPVVTARWSSGAASGAPGTTGMFFGNRTASAAAGARTLDKNRCCTSVTKPNFSQLGQLCEGHAKSYNHTILMIETLDWTSTNMNLLLA